MKYKICFILLLSVFFVCSCEKNSQQSPNLQLQYVVPSYTSIGLTKGQQEISGSIDKFAFDLFNESDRSKDLIVSPYSLSMALTMAVLGSNGDTRDEIVNTLGFNGVPDAELCDFFQVVSRNIISADPSVKFISANSIWTNSISLNNGFVHDCSKYFDTEVYTKMSKDAVNQWVAAKTEGNIQEFLDEFDSAGSTCMLLNAMYLKAPWAFTFEETSNKSISARLATLYFESDNLVGIELPYGNGSFVMDVVMPASEGQPSSIAMNMEKWEDFLNTASLCDVTVKLPVFSFATDARMKKLLKTLGISCAFSESADFSPMIADYSLVMRDVIQKSKIGVDVKGTEASAASAVEFVFGSPNSGMQSTLRKVSFCPSAGFMFIIREVSTNTILFIGQHCQ